MPIETATFIHQLDPANPLGSDLKSTLDNHARLTKSALQATFPAILGAVTASHTNLNKVGVTQAPGNNTTDPASTAFVQAALSGVGGAGVATVNGRSGAVSVISSDVTSALGFTPANISSPVFLGNPTAPTQLAGDNSLRIASTAFVQAAVGGGDGGVVTIPIVTVTGATQTMAAGSHYVFTNVAAVTATLPPTPTEGQSVRTTFVNVLTTNAVARNGSTIMGIAQDITLDIAQTNILWQYLSSSWRI